MKQRDLLFFLASGCLVVLAWIAFTLVHNSFTSTIDSSTSEAIAPIEPKFDTATLKKIGNRTVVNPAFTISVVPTISLTPSPTPTPIPFTTNASSSAKTASQGGTLQ